jgi:putative membrane protein (TIGR04086 family)
MESAFEKSAEKNERKPFKLPVKALIFGAVSGTVLFFAFLALAAAFLPLIGAKEAWLPYISVLLGGVSSFISSYAAAKAKGSNGLLLGLACAAAQMLLLSIVLLIFAGGLGIPALFLCAALLGCGGAGGVFGVNAVHRG